MPSEGGPGQGVVTSCSSPWWSWGGGGEAVVSVVSSTGVSFDLNLLS